MMMMMMMMMSHTTLSHTALSQNLSSTISFTFAAFPLPSSWLFFTFGRSRHVGLACPKSDDDDDYDDDDGDDDDDVTHNFVTYNFFTHSSFTESVFHHLLYLCCLSSPIFLVVFCFWKKSACCVILSQK